MKQKPWDAHISKFRLIDFYNQSIVPSDREIYPNSKIIQQFLNKLTFEKTYISKTNKDDKFSTYVEHNSSSFEGNRSCVVSVRSI